MNLKRLYLICFSIASLGSLNAQAKYAKIVVYRNENTRENVEEVYKVFANDNLTTGLKNYHFEEFYMSEGSFLLKVNEIYAAIRKVECVSGHTYYFRINRDLGLPDKSITIIAVDSIIANNELKYLKTHFVSQPKVVKLKRNNGIGAFFEPGVGLEKIGLFGTTTGMQVMHSFGGGVAFGLSYSYKFSDYFGWSAGLTRQFSILNPTVTNASVTFKQGILSTTPYFTIPVVKKHKQKIRIGGGMDYHFNPVLNIETGELVNGFDDNWTYNKAFGYHLITFYEMTNGNYRGHAGFKYSDVRYEFIWGEAYAPLEPKLKTPRGNSISFCLGLEYCF